MRSPVGRKEVEDYDERIIKALKYCWDKGIYAYPLVHDGRGKRCPDVKIQMRIGNKKVTGEIVYSQKDDALYKKINELYLHHYEKRND